MILPRPGKSIIPLSLAVLGVALFSPWIFSGRVLFGSDLIMFFYPLLTAVRDGLAGGIHIPLWTSRVLGGFSLAADPQASIFYPPAWVLFTGSFERLLGFYLMVHLWWAGLGASVVFRKAGASKTGAFFGGAAFMLGTVLPYRILAGHLTYLQAAAWLPWMTAAFLQYLTSRRPRYLALTSLCVGLSLTAGFPQITFYSLLWLLWTALAAPRPGPKKPIRSMGTAGLTIGLGFGIAAALLVPAWELTRMSVRTQTIDYSFLISDSLPPAHLLTLLLPSLFGSIPSMTYWPGAIYQWWEFTAYQGLFPWAVVPALGRPFRQHPAFRYLMIPVGVTLLLALGGHIPLYRLIALLPGFNLFRLPSQILFLTAFSLAGLTAIGITVLTSHPPTSKKILALPLGLAILFGGIVSASYIFPGAGVSILRFLFPNQLSTMPWGTRLLLATRQFAVSGVIALGLALALWVFIFFRRRPASFVPLGIIILLDLFLPARPVVAPTDLDLYYPSLRMTSEWPRVQEPYRVFPYQKVFTGDEPMRGGWESIGGYNPLLTASFAHLLNVMEGRPWPSQDIGYEYFTNHRSPVAALLNCRVVMSEIPLDDPSLELVDDRQPKVYIKKDALPRAMVYPTVSFLPDSEIPSRLSSFDPHREVLVGEGIVLPAVGTTGSPRSARVFPISPERLVILDPTGTGGYLLVSQNFHPGWKAFWEEERLPVVPADLALSLIPLPAGCRKVELRFSPTSFRIGLWISLFALLGTAVLFMVRRR